jgi:hypothetical protein
MCSFSTASFQASIEFNDGHCLESIATTINQQTHAYGNTKLVLSKKATIKGAFHGHTNSYQVG